MRTYALMRVKNLAIQQIFVKFLLFIDIDCRFIKFTPMLHVTLSKSCDQATRLHN